MARKKLERFAALKSLPNVREIGFDQLHELELVNFTKVFENSNSVVLELGCGYGEHALALAEQFPHKNFIGIDIQGERIYRGAKLALEQGLKNVFFIRISIDWLDKLVEPKSIDEIWITFPDPHPKKPNKRLVAPKFLEMYSRLLGNKGRLIIKTDSEIIVDDVVNNAVQGWKLILKAENIELNLEVKDIVGITQSRYEKKFLASDKTIKCVILQKVS